MNYHESSKKPVSEGSSVNVIYFTNECNLACTYCYQELHNKEKEVLKQPQIRKYIDDIVAKEPPQEQTLFVLFGGEATLEWDNVKYFMYYAYFRKKNVFFSLESNGIKFNNPNFVQEFKSLLFYKLNILTLDISFDGIGNEARLTKGGTSSTPTVLNAINNLHEADIPFRLRYTIHKLNVHDHYNDIISISKNIKPSRIILTVDWDNLEESHINIVKETKIRLQNDWLNDKIDIPVCELFCETCSGCNNVKDTRSYFSNQGNIRTHKEVTQFNKFNDFKAKEEHV